MAGAKKPSKTSKDLSPKPSRVVKGGKLAANENMTLVRGAKPAKQSKDFSPKPSRVVKGGKLATNENLTLMRGATKVAQ